MIKAISTKKPADILVRAGDQALVFLRVPKVASTAMSYYFNARGGKAIGRRDALKHPDRLAFLRHPVERLKSAYQWGWCKHGQRNVPFNDWWDQVRVNPSFDIHTMPMSVHLQSHATEVYQLEEMALWWGGLVQKYPFAFNADMPLRANVRASEPVDVDAEVYVEIMAVYAEDYERWLKASVSGLEEEFRRDPWSQAADHASATDAEPPIPPVRVAPVGTIQRKLK